MSRSRPLVVTMAGILATLASTRADATTFLRQGIDDLTRRNDLVVVGRVLDLHSRWSGDHSVIVTDVRVAPREVLKGNAPAVLTLTVLGGAVGDLVTVEAGGPVFRPGSEYVLFLSRHELPGCGEVLTAPDLVQGVFDVVPAAGASGARAVSQAAAEAMVADDEGLTGAPGGTAGLALQAMLEEIGRVR